MKKITILFNSFYVLLLLFLILEELTPLDISNQSLKSFVYYGTLLLSPILITWNWIALKPVRIKAVGIVIPLTIITLIMSTGLRFFFSTGAWQTEVIEYQNKLSTATIEFQLQDTGALGYNKRTVKVYHLSSFFMIVSEVPKDVAKNPEWIKVGKDIGNRLKC